MRIGVVGAGGHSRVVCECLRLVLGQGTDLALFDDGDPLDRQVPGANVIGTTEDLVLDRSYPHAFVAIGDNAARRAIARRLSGAGKAFPTLIHPWTAVSPDARVGRGTIAVAGTVVNAAATVGEHVILNTHCSVGHDCRVEDFAQVGPGVNLGGGVVVEEGAFLAIGAKVVPNARIGAWAVIGAGSVVLEDVPPGTLSYGVPAKVVRRLKPGA